MTVCLEHFRARGLLKARGQQRTDSTVVLGAVRDLFRYALVLAMIDDEKARVTGTRPEAGQEYLMVRTVAEDEFETLRPRFSEEVEAKLTAQAGAILEEDSGG